MELTAWQNKRHAIIRKLPAVETLGGATVICSDKTGTLTENKMTVQGIYAGGQHFQVTGTGYNPQGEILFEQQPVDLQSGYFPALADCLRAGLLCTDSHLAKNSNGNWSVVSDPTECAIIRVANKAGWSQSEMTKLTTRIDAIPFESEFQYMATLHDNQDSESRIIYVKGSVEAITSRCEQMLNAEGELEPMADLELIEQRVVTILAKQGMRVLAFGKKIVSHEQNSVDHYLKLHP